MSKAESLLRNNYGKEAIKHELSAAPQPTGAQSKQSGQVRVPGPQENADGETAINGQWPQLALTACPVDKGVNAGTPPRGDEWSLARHAGEALKWCGRSHTIARHAQWAGQYNGVRYLLQYVHWA